jgi:two-component system response regulator AtoC
MDVLEFEFHSQSLRNVQSKVRNLAPSHSPVIICGETGTGKTTWAQAMARFHGVIQVIESHEAPRSVKAWRDLEICWDRSPVLLESLDKWSDGTQASFASFMKERKTQIKKIIATSSPRILSRVREGSFRSDLYCALSVQRVDLPRLIDCQEDFLHMAQFWVDVHGLVRSRGPFKISTAALDQLKLHRWHGNFAEFVNVLERACDQAIGSIDTSHLFFDEWEGETSQLEAGLTLAEVEKKLIMQTLSLTAQNKSQAARILGISIRTLRNKLNEYRQEVNYELV